MSAPNAKPQPKRGLTWPRQKAVILSATAPLALLDLVLEIQFPLLPLMHPFFGAFMAQVFIVFPFQGLSRPVDQPRLIMFVIAADLAAMAIMPGVATMIHALGWTKPDALYFAIGFPGTMLTIGVVQQWLFRTMIRRHDAPPEEQEDRA